MHGRWRAVAPALVLLALVSCGRSGPTGPDRAVQFALSGSITSTTGGAIAGARVEVTAGRDAGRSVDADAGGRYRLSALSAGTLTVRASAAGFGPVEQTLTLSTDRTLDLTLAPAQYSAQGRVLDVLTLGGVAGVSVSGTDLQTTITDTAGAFTAIAGQALAEPREVVFAGGGRVDRETHLRVPGPEALVTMIPSSFDLVAFDQMFRTPVLRRWLSAPPLQVVSQVLEFESLSAPELRVLDEPVGAADRQSIVDDLAWALPQLTGDTYDAFASVDVVSPGIGSDLRVLNTGVITVARVSGLTAGSGYWGYARWQWSSNNAIISGLVMLDRDFELSGSPFRRSLRAHELGHALGYNHVTSRASVMNSSARLEPNAFDLDAARIAFARVPGNRSPDIDGPSFSTNVSVIGAVWSPPVR